MLKIIKNNLIYTKNNTTFKYNLKHIAYVKYISWII
ncbi:hypothetical protein CLV73_0298 [Chryseobacterium geocarposphaerae]|uniref:Uncharacterized protein n=1 Tax=Chryseobacterium geocarposphaerae TaxID=1416776 RepID=A0A2M9C688_9FLAO|nr:hypothetical protein CLV73_0298 [Chryseobacterium geocarposphaerae]